MTDCCDERDASPLELIPAGLATLPRQARSFAEVRRDLLAALPHKSALAGWRPSGNDYGLMWLEMWAYVADVVGFYDARIADQSYVGTAVERKALRRVVALLGYTPAGGIAGRADLAVLAKGRVSVTLPIGTGFRSRGFATEAPQVFESDAVATVHPLKNLWRVDAFVRHPTIDAVAASTGSKDKSQGKGSASSSVVHQLLFETAGFGLAAESLVLFEHRDAEPQVQMTPAVTKVVRTEPFAGKDKRTYVRVTFAPGIVIPPDLDLHRLRVRRPIQSTMATANTPLANGKGTVPAIVHLTNLSSVFLDGPPRGFAAGAPVIVAKALTSAEPQMRHARVTAVLPAAVRLDSIPPGDGGSPVVAATKLELSPGFASLGDATGEITFHHDFVDAGTATNVGRTEIGVTELTSPEGVPITGVVAPPPEAVATAIAQGLGTTSEAAGVLEQAFLYVDAADRGGRLQGRLTIGRDGRGSFQALVPEELAGVTLTLPLRLYGNVVTATRGESVFGEVLGNGDARTASQHFTLKKKPLTYLPQPSASGDATTQSTLQIHVGGILWREVADFFGCGPEDRVYVVRHDDEQVCHVIFGDGVRGMRLPSGIKNVVASHYRFGAGFAAPPAGAITQLARPASGIDGVVSPAAAKPGKDPETAETLRTDAPRRALLLGRIVSVVDYESVAASAPGVVSASAQWLWIDAQMQAGVQVHYIGDAEEAFIVETLRAQADPTMPLAVTKASPIPASISIEVEVDASFVKSAVAAAVVEHLRDPVHGFLSLARASIGGAFWPSRLFAAVSEVAGVVAVGGVAFVTPSTGPHLADAGPTCIPTGHYLDFSAAEAVVATGVDPTGSSAPGGGA